MAYNSYAILDEKIAIVDTVDKSLPTRLDNIEKPGHNESPII